MTEMAYTREDHGNAAFVRGSDHLGVADTAAGLDDGNRTVIGDDIESITEWKKRI